MKVENRMWVGQRRVMGGKWEQLYLNNNKMIKKKKKFQLVPPFSHPCFGLVLLLLPSIHFSLARIFFSHLSILHELFYLALANLPVIVKWLCRKIPAKKPQVEDNKNHEFT